MKLVEQGRKPGVAAKLGQLRPNGAQECCWGGVIFDAGLEPSGGAFEVTDCKTNRYQCRWNYLLSRETGFQPVDEFLGLFVSTGSPIDEAQDPDI